MANGEATEDAAIGGRPFSETQQMKVALRTALDAINVPLAAYRIGDGDAEMPAWQKAYLNLAAICIGIAESFWCSTLIILCIIMAGLQLGIDTQLFPEGNDGMMPFAPIGIKSDDPIFLQAQYIDYGVNLIFTSELILKVIGEGFQPWLFFRTGWNQMDFVIVSLSWRRVAPSLFVFAGHRSQPPLTPASPPPSSRSPARGSPAPALSRSSASSASFASSSL